VRFSRRSLLLVAFAAVSSSGCKKEKKASNALAGSGIQKTKEVEIAAFSRLAVKGKMQVFVTIGGHRSMEVKGDDDIIGHVRARLENGVMTIDTDVPVRGKMPLEVRVGAAKLDSISGSGAARIQIEGLAAKDFGASAAGASRIAAEGAAETISITGKDAAQFDFTKVVARSAKAHLVKAASARVGYLEELDVRIQDATRFFYEGEPKLTKDVKRPALLVKTK
jgi:hypothetical protein